MRTDRVTIEMRHRNSFTHEPLWVVTHTAWVLTKGRLFPWQLKDLSKVKKEKEFESAVVTGVESELTESDENCSNDINDTKVLPGN